MPIAALDEPIKPRAGGELDVPLSTRQQRMYHLCTTYPGTSSPILYLCWRLRGPVDLAAWERAASALVDRHESLRTVFAIGPDGPFARIAPPAGIATEYVDMTAVASQDDRHEQTQQALVSRTRALLDLEHGPLVASAIFTMAPEDHVWCFTVHHLLADGTSMTLLSREMRALYRAFRDGQEPDLAPPPIGYGDFAVWQRDLAGQGEMDSLKYWVERLAGMPGMELPTDLPRPPEKGTRLAEYNHLIRGDLADRLERLAGQTGSTLFMVMLAVLAALFSLESGEDDVCVGTVVAGRDRVELESVVGMFVNSLAMRCDTSGNPTFAELLGRVRTTSLEAMDHADVPFGRVVTALDLPRDISRTPVFQTLFVLHSELPADDLRVGDLNIRDYLFVPPQGIYDLMLHGWRGPNLLNTEYRYDSALFLPETMARLARRYEALMRAVVDNPEMRLFEMAMLPVPDAPASND